MTHVKHVLVTGQSGTGSSAFFRKVADELNTNPRFQSQSPRPPQYGVHSVGELMYREARNVPAGRILSLSERELELLRAMVMGELNRSLPHSSAIVCTHAAFGGPTGIHHGHRLEQLRAFSPDVIFHFVDSFHHVWWRLKQRGTPVPMRSVLKGREFEEFASRGILHGAGKQGTQYSIVTRGPNDRRVSSVADLVFNSPKLRVYPSFPMTHVASMPEVLARIDAFRDAVAELSIVADPGDVDEKAIFFQARAAQKKGEATIPCMIDGVEVQLPVAELLEPGIEDAVDEQICWRDFKLIDQSDMIISYFPAGPDGRPCISSGVERELHHAYSNGKEVWILWLVERALSPFVTQFATRVFRSESELLAALREQKRPVMTR